MQGLLTGVAEGMVEGLGEPAAEVEGLTPGLVSGSGELHGAQRQGSFSLGRPGQGENR